MNGLESIPGMGIIRARSFRKAGYTDVESLRRATMDDLCAVPGITAIKARQIHDYLRTGGSDEATVHLAAASRDEPAALLDDRFVSSVWEKTRECSSNAASLLSSERAHNINSRLARQLGKIAALVSSKAGPRSLAQEEAQKAWECLRKLSKKLEEVRASGHLGHRQQDKVADKLREIRKKLASILE